MSNIYKKLLLFRMFGCLFVVHSCIHHAFVYLSKLGHEYSHIFSVREVKVNMGPVMQGPFTLVTKLPEIIGIQNG